MCLSLRQSPEVELSGVNSVLSSGEEHVDRQNGQKEEEQREQL